MASDERGGRAREEMRSVRSLPLVVLSLDRQARPAMASGAPHSTDAPSPPASRSPSPALQLDPSTLAALSAFYDEQADAERQFQELEKKAHERLEQAREGNAAGALPLSLSSSCTAFSPRVDISRPLARRQRDDERRRVPHPHEGGLAAVAVLVRPSLARRPLPREERSQLTLPLSLRTGTLPTLRRASPPSSTRTARPRPGSPSSRARRRTSASSTRTRSPRCTCSSTTPGSGSSPATSLSSTTSRSPTCSLKSCAARSTLRSPTRRSSTRCAFLSFCLSLRGSRADAPLSHTHADDEPLLCADAQRAPPADDGQARPPHVDLDARLPPRRLRLPARRAPVPHRLCRRARREPAAERVWRVDELGVGGRGRGGEVRGAGRGGVTRSRAKRGAGCEL